MSTYTYIKLVTHLSHLEEYLKLAISKIDGLSYSSASTELIVITSSPLTELEITDLEELLDSYTNPSTIKVEKDTVSYSLNTEYANSQEYSLLGNFIYIPANMSIDKITLLPYSSMALEGTWSFKLFNSTNFSTLYESTNISNLNIQTIDIDVSIPNEVSVLEIHVKTSSSNFKVKISYISISRFSNE